MLGIGDKSKENTRKRDNPDLDNEIDAELEHKSKPQIYWDTDAKKNELSKVVMACKAYKKTEICKEAK